MAHNIAIKSPKTTAKLTQPNLFENNVSAGQTSLLIQMKLQYYILEDVAIHVSKTERSVVLRKDRREDRTCGFLPTEHSEFSLNHRDAGKSKDTVKFR